MEHNHLPKHKIYSLLPFGVNSSELSELKVDDTFVFHDTLKGSYWNNFGRKIQQKMILCGEEALFLVEQGNLELCYGGTPLSLQQAFSILLPNAFSLCHYLIYAYLLRLGYMVIRHHKRTNTQYKTEQILEKKESRSVKSCCDGYCELCTTPLVQPRDAKSTSSVLSKLQVIKPHKMETDIHSINGVLYTIDFDVFLPGSHFKKSDPGLPAFCISVCRFSDDPPSLAVLNYLTQQCKPVPLKFGLIADGTITINSLLDVEIPMYKNK